MCKICSQNNLFRWNPIKERVKDFIHKIIIQFDIEKIILFGSFARGDYHENSDIDLIIVGNFKESFFERIGMIREFEPNDLEFEILVYTNEEFKKMLEHGNPFIEVAINEGVSLI